MLLVRGDGIVEEVNRSLTRLSGLAAAEVVGRRLAEITAESADTIASLLRTFSRSNHLLPGSLTLVGRDGDPVPCRCEGALFRKRTAGVPAVVLVRLLRKASAVERFMTLNQRIDELRSEVSRRRRAEHALDAQREWLRVTLESIGDAVMAADAEGRITFMNPSACSLTGYAVEDALGESLDRVFHIVNEHSRADVESPVARVLREGVVVGLANHTILIRRDGTELAIDDSAAPIRAADGAMLGVVLVFHDVTDRRRLERSLREHRDSLAQADRRKDEFLAMLAHELRNPLAPLLSGSQVLRAVATADRNVQRIGDMMERQIQHLARLIDDLLDVSRITRGTIELKRTPMALRPVLERAVEMTSPLVAERQHELSLHLPPASLHVHADATRLAQVFANLLSNAAKFTEPGGRLSLRAEAAGGEAVVRVQDDGVGIQADMLSKVFELFSQADKSLERTEGGLGLGLTVVKVLVEMHEGTVEAHSEGIGRGSEFVVRLPAMSQQVTSTAPADAVPAEETTPVPAPLRVLVVDDNRDAAESLAMLLHGWSHEVRTAHTGPEALAASATFQPDVILLDIGLPIMDGYEVARRLRERPDTREAVLVAVTGYGRREDRRRSREVGFDEHLTKPVAADALRKLLAKA
jgi:PAS domain S-box-containing protein